MSDDPSLPEGIYVDTSRGMPVLQIDFPGDGTMKAGATCTAR
jgi:hypothetical protein